MTPSKLVLGTVQFGLKYGIANTGSQPGFSEVCRILETAYSRGVTTLDTAASYGESEKVLGKALQATGLAGKINVISKISSLPEGVTADQAEKWICSSLENSLKNLRRDSLYALLFHREKDWKYASVLERCRKEGLICHYGCSVDGALPENHESMDVVQIPGNVLDKRFFPFLKSAGKRGCSIYVRSVYLQGLLLMEEERVPASLQGLLPYRRKLAALAQESGISLAELCVRYLCSFPEIKGVLTGVDTVEQLDHNLDLAEKGALQADVLLAVEKMIPVLPEEWIRPSLWKK